MTKQPAKRSRIVLVRGDITRDRNDAIVNAANSSLMGGGGVDGAIHRAAGPELLDECRLIGGCPAGEARITKGYRLPARWVIHTVGPVWRGGHTGEDELLSSCYRESLKLGAEVAAKTIAFPAISTGVYRFPVERACRVALSAIQGSPFLGEFDEIRLVCFDDEVFEAYTALL